MPATKCSVCDHAHRIPPARNQTKFCFFHDPDTHVDKRLADHRGLPEDCPGCLGRGTINKKPFGRRQSKGTAADYILTCRECRVQYFWSDK